MEIEQNKLLTEKEQLQMKNIELNKEKENLEIELDNINNQLIKLKKEYNEEKEKIAKKEGINEELENLKNDNKILKKELEELKRKLSKKIQFFVVKLFRFASELINLLLHFMNFMRMNFFYISLFDYIQKK